MTRHLFATIASVLLAVPYGLAQNDATSANNELLAKALKRFPEADANKDGVLTFAEGVAFRANRGAKGRAKGEDAPEADHEFRQPTPRTVSGKDVPAEKAIKGYNGLYMGHSFFKPAAEHLLQLIPDTTIVNHTESIIFAGGIGGSPKVMWWNPKTSEPGKKCLDAGNIDFLTMTYFSPETSSIDDYANWFDYAIALEVYRKIAPYNAPYAKKQ